MKRILLGTIVLSMTLHAGFLDSVMNTVSSMTGSTQEQTQQNEGLIENVKKETGLSTTQTMGAIGTLLGYASNNTSQNDYEKVTNNVPGLSSFTNSTTISPIISSLTSSEMVQSSLKSFGIDPSLVQTIVPILVNYVTKQGGEESGSIISNALSGLLK